VWHSRHRLRLLDRPQLVATVEHVVAGATTIRLVRQGKTLGTGTVIGDDPVRDVALVRSSKRLSGHVFQFASRAPALGASVAALGFPLGLPLSVSQGSVSGTGRTIPIDGVNRRQLVQTDAAVNPGNSGGPLLSLDSGRVVGLVDLGTIQANGIAFAVSAQVAKPLFQAWETAPQSAPPGSCGSVGSTATSTASATGGPPPSPGALPAGISGWTVILASKASEADAQAVASAAVADGLPQVGVLFSSDHASLRPGFWVAFSAAFSTTAALTRCSSKLVRRASPPHTLSSN
jgi:S1-C subfamily serine protease